MHRRHFLQAALAAGGSAALSGCAHRWPVVSGAPGPIQAPRTPLWIPPTLRTDDAHLLATRHRALVASGTHAEVWSPGDGPIGPTLRARRGERVTLLLENRLPEPTILHWHGLHVPEAADGHPRLAIDPGASY